MVDQRRGSRPQGGGEEAGEVDALLHVPVTRLKSETSKSKPIWSRAVGEGIVGLYLLVQFGPFPLDGKGLGPCPSQYFCVSLESSKVTGTVRVNTQ